MEYDNLFNTHYKQFLHEFGERKILKIKSILDNSRHTKSLLNQCYLKKLTPNAADLRQCVLGNIKLSFASKQTELFAMALLLKKFNEEVNVNNCITPEFKIIEIYGKFYSTFTY